MSSIACTVGVCVHSFAFAFPAAPGLVTNLTAFAQNHTSVMVTWFLPHRINGLITKFAVKAKHARTGQTVRTLEVNAEDIMTGALPHCNVLQYNVALCLFCYCAMFFFCQDYRC